MKRLLATLILIVCLSFPANAGHVLGSGIYCDCNNPESHTLNGVVRDDNQETIPDSNTELGLLLVAVLLYLKARA